MFLEKTETRYDYFVFFKGKFYKIEKAHTAASNRCASIGIFHKTQWFYKIELAKFHLRIFSFSYFSLNNNLVARALKKPK